MRRSLNPIPTESELSILNVLWDKGPSTVRAVFDVLNLTRETGYTTVLKLMQIMTEKKLVKRDESNRTHVYEANYSKQQTQRWLIDDLLNKAFGGSSTQLANALFEKEKLSKTEFEKLRNEIIALREKEKNHGEFD
jgi:predicted transcriptional regulator